MILFIVMVAEAQLYFYFEFLIVKFKLIVPFWITKSTKIHYKFDFDCSCINRLYAVGAIACR